MIFSYINNLFSFLKIKNMENNNKFENMENNNSFYLIATLARSFDQYHVKNKKIHLIASVFYTDKDLINNISLLQNNNDIHLIIRVLRREDDYFKIIEHNANSVEFYCSWSHLLSKSINNSLEHFMEGLIGSYHLESKLGGNILNNVYFIFEDTTWLNLQLLFKIINIQLSGGSITRRQFLSTNQYYLSFFLLKLGYNYEDIYNSINYNKDISSGFLDSNDLMKDKKLIILYIQIFFNILLKNIYFTRDSIENEIKSLKGNLSALQSEQSSIKVKNEQQNTKKYIKLNKNIENLNKNIEFKLEKLSLLSSEEQSIKTEFERIRKLPFDELRELYFNKYHNNKVYKDSTKLNDYVTKIKQNKYKPSYP